MTKTLTLGIFSCYLPYIALSLIFFYKYPYSSPAENSDNIDLVYLGHKCLTTLVLPILSIINHGFANATPYTRKITLGLLLAVTGDLLIVYNFMAGLVLFALVHVSYLSAFGFKPFKPILAVVCLAVEIIVSFYFTSRLSDPILITAIPIYGFLLLSTVWRANAKVDLSKPLTILCGLGAISFCSSDIILSYIEFVQKLTYSNLIVMSTYYFAQFAIALSTYEEGYSRKDKPKGH